MCAPTVIMLTVHIIFQVRKLEYEGTDMYEIHAQLPGISKEGVK